MKRAVHLMLACGWCPLWLSAALLAYQALTEMTEASERQVTR